MICSGSTMKFTRPEPNLLFFSETPVPTLHWTLLSRATWWFSQPGCLAPHSRVSWEVCTRVKTAQRSSTLSDPSVLPSPSQSPFLLISLLAGKYQVHFVYWPYSLLPWISGTLIIILSHFSVISSKSTPVAQTVKNLPALQETWVWSLGWEDPPEKGMATHPSILGWRIPWTEELVGLQSMGLQRQLRLSG